MIKKGVNILLVASLVSMGGLTSHSEQAEAKQAVNYESAIETTSLLETSEQSTGEGPTVSASEATQDEYDKLRARWFAYWTGEQGYDQNDPDIAKSITLITEKVSNAGKTGFWDTLNTQPNRTYLWSDQPASSANGYSIVASYNRLRDMAVAFSTSGSPLFGNVQLKTDIIDAMDWLYENWYNESKMEAGNWFEWEIGAPLALGDTMTLMYEYLSQEQISKYAKAIDRFCPDPTKRTIQPTVTETGANRMDKALIVILRGIHEKNDAKIMQGRNAISQVLAYVTSGDGFYVDGSFIQHNNIAYTGSYGAVLLGDMMKVMTLLSDSPWPITDPNLKNVFNWITDSFEPVTFRKVMLDMVFGRSVARGNRQLVPWSHILRLAAFAPPEQASYFRSMVKYWFEADTTVANYYDGLRVADTVLLKSVMEDESIQPIGDLTLHKQFSAMDRVVHYRPGYVYGISMSSARIANYETGTENLKGWYTGDGMTYLYNSDLNQYHDGFWATVNPYRLPGVTSDGATRVSAKTTSKTWVGGSSLDHLYGAAGMDLNPNNSTLKGKKSWFMFDDEIIALGAGISAADNRGVETIVENRKLNADGSNALVVDGEEKPSELGWSETMNSVHWAHLDGNVPGSDIGYYFPDGSNVKALREARTGSWRDIDTAGSTEQLTRNYASLAIDHGMNPVNESYSYVLLPNKDTASTANYSQNPDIEIISNNDNIQAVKEKKLGLTAVNFWSPGLIDSVRSLNPASVMVKKDGDELEISVSDPTQTQSSVRIAVANAAVEELQKDPAITILSMSPYIELNIDTSGSKGKSHAIKLRIDPNAEPSDLTEPKPDEGIQTKLTVTENAYVNGGSKAATNFSAVNYLQIRNGSGETDRKAFLKFDLSSFVGEVGMAKLHLYGKTNDGSGTVSDIGVFRVDNDAWKEAEITYNNAPAIGSLINQQTFSGPDQWREFDITSLASSEHAGDKIMSLALKQVGTNLASDMRSRTNENGIYSAYVEIWPKDTTPPTTQAKVVGDLAEDNAYIGEVNLSFDAVDSSDGDAVGWGIRHTEYRINGGSWLKVTGDVTLQKPGTYQIAYRSVDNAGNVEPSKQLNFLIHNGQSPSVPPVVTPPITNQPSIIKVTRERAEQLAARGTGSAGELKLAGDALEIQAVSGGKDGILPKAIEMTLSYSSTMTDLDLIGVYYYNETIGNWEYVRSVLAADKQQLSVTTDKPGVYSVMEYNKSFMDIPSGHWAERAVKVLAAKAIVNGSDDRHYNPTGQTTRAEFAALLVRLLGLQAGESYPFNDVADNAWYAADVSAAFQSGIVSGTTDREFNPNAPITREQMAIMVVRAFVHVNGKQTIGSNPLIFSDRSDISSWAEEAVRAAVKLGLMQGNGNGRFSPQDNATRAETAMVVWNLLKALK
ncbi:polysaccharide lyase family 8 super-sandwich domain-containing protein [Paenibacillus sp. MMO-58]|uniref:polysaccharide lyase family 8 super-sandwich domain-containing protein n=1 Tax=Paenibacillus sp. MMO-58 TaxID=3081290 RepID=UPI003017EFB2